MDRFIDGTPLYLPIAIFYLKSNMDRFIVIGNNPVLSAYVFKIQYG